MSLGRQAVGVDKIGVLKPQRRCLFVHGGNEGFFATVNRLCKGYGGIVGGDHDQGFQQIVHGHLLPRLQEYLRPAHGCRPLADGNHVRKGQLALIDSLHDQKGCHHLGYAGDGKPLVLVVRKQNLPRRGLHEQSTLAWETAFEGGGRNTVLVPKRLKSKIIGVNIRLLRGTRGEYPVGKQKNCRNTAAKKSFHRRHKRTFPFFLSLCGRMHKREQKNTQKKCKKFCKNTLRIEKFAV